VIIDRGTDCGAIYDAERLALIDLLGGLPPEGLATRVEATPDWDLHDVVAHLVGITADLNAGSFGAAGDDAWTAQQVAGRRGQSLADMATEWDAQAPTFTSGLALFGYELGSHFVGDLLQHIADVHHALGLPRRADDDPALVVALDFYLDAFHDTLVEEALGTVDISANGEPWHVGSGPVTATLTCGRFELFRALGGRRSLGQIRAMTWSGDAEAIVPHVSRYGLPRADLIEP
jgi:uncharacterized protein (TIGR03083 family)